MSIAKRLPILGLIIAALLLAACGGGADSSQGIGRAQTVPGGSYTNVSVAELRQMLAKKDFLFINTHIPFEGDIGKTDRSIPYDQIGDRAAKLLPDKDAKIVLYCRSGTMSTEAAQTLVRLGYSAVYELDGGMRAWERAGLPLEGR